MKTADCLADVDLLSLIDGNTTAPSAADHLSTCADCRERMKDLKEEMGTMRSAAKGFAFRAAAGSEPARTVVEPDRPSRIGRYVIVGVLDEGGQAVVYRAVDATLGRDVVLKLSRKPLDRSSELADLLVKEARLLAQLEHPHIAPVYDLDTHEGRPFLAIKYVRGQTLEQEGAERRLAPARVAEIAAKIARALAEAHRQGAVHQDVKPRNILVADNGEPCLIDFGIARLRDAWAENRREVIGGTAAYMAPEQARAEAGRIGPRSDVFALGGVLYYLLTGGPPFTSKDPTTLLDKAGRCAFDRGKLAASGAPAALRRACLRAMEAEPEDRYASADEMAEALERFISRPARLRRTLAAAVAVLAAASAAGWGYRLSHAPKPPIHHDEPAPPTIVREQEFIRVIRRGEPMNLKSALPLRADDQMQLTYDIPIGWHYAVFALGTDGSVSTLTPETLGGPAGVVRLKYPPGGAAAPLDARGGTEVVFVCAGVNPIDVAAVRSILEQSGPPPKLPADVVVELGNDAVTPVRAARGSGLGAPVRNTLAAVEDLLERVRRELKREGAEVVRGAAFSH